MEVEVGLMLRYFGWVSHQYKHVLRPLYTTPGTLEAHGCCAINCCQFVVMWSFGSQVIKAIFQEIAVVFVPQNYSSTHEDLQLRASQAAMRWELQIVQASSLSCFKQRNTYIKLQFKSHSCHSILFPFAYKGARIVLQSIL